MNHKQSDNQVETNHYPNHYIWRSVSAPEMLVIILYCTGKLCTHSYNKYGDRNDGQNNKNKALVVKTSVMPEIAPD